MARCGVGIGVGGAELELEMPRGPSGNYSYRQGWLAMNNKIEGLPVYFIATRAICWSGTMDGGAAEMSGSSSLCIPTYAMWLGGLSWPKLLMCLRGSDGMVRVTGC